MFIPCIIISQTIDYFPAHVGNTYEYETSNYESNQKTYYRTTITNIIAKSDGGIDIYYNNSTSPRYYKAANGNVYQYVNTPPSLWYDFTTTSHDTFYTNIGSSELYVVVYYYGTSQLFGKNTSARSFTFYDKKFHSMSGHHVLSDGFGIIDMDSNIYPPTWSSLIGCIINGNRYGTLVDVKEEPFNTNYELYQNYPNPFNSSTIIKYTLYRPSWVSLTIYNMLGIQIEKLIDEYIGSGLHSVNFDASKYASGIYFYKLSCGKYQSVKKLLYLK